MVWRKQKSSAPASCRESNNDFSVTTPTTVSRLYNLDKVRKETKELADGCIGISK
jgi:hypothetical protein